MHLIASLLQLTLVPYRRRRGRGLFLRPINSVKNIVDSTTLGVAAGTVTNVTLANAVNDYTGASATVPIGSKVHGVYLFFQIILQSVGTNVDMYVWKGPQTLQGSMPIPGATGGDQNRKFILHEEKGIPGTLNNGASPLTFRGVIKLPKGRQRMAENDLLEIKFRGAAVYDACIKCIYKFYQ